MPAHPPFSTPKLPSNPSQNRATRCELGHSYRCVSSQHRQKLLKLVSQSAQTHCERYQDTFIVWVLAIFILEQESKDIDIGDVDIYVGRFGRHCVRFSPTFSSKLATVTIASNVGVMRLERREGGSLQ